MYEWGFIAQVELTYYYKENIKDTFEFNEVYECAKTLLSFLNEEETIKNINKANQPGASSAKVQKIILEKAQDLGFTSEKKGLFSKYTTSGLRPDYYKKLSGTGILFEVERGKTIQNNMDLLDLWKCHICEEADYLFLLVPMALKQRANGRSQNTYKSVCARLNTFFREENYINVKAVFIFGY